MFRRKLFKRALPLILSVALVFQSMPATARAAENETEVVETAVEDSGTESETGEDVNEPASEDPETPAEEQMQEETSAPAEEQMQEIPSVSAEESAQESAIQKAASDEEEASTEEMQQAEADTDAAAQIVIDEEALKNNLNGLEYKDSVVSGSYVPEGKLFDAVVNTLKADNTVISIKIGNETNDNLNDKLVFRWNKVEKQEGAADKLTALDAGETPTEAGTYRLVLSLDAVDGLCQAAENVSIDFEIKKAVLKVRVDGKAEIGTKLTDFVKVVKEHYVLSDANKESLNKDIFVKDVTVAIKDAITGDNIDFTDETVFEKGKDYSYTIAVALNDTEDANFAKNYEVEEVGVLLIALQGDIETQMEITPLKSMEYTFGDEVAFPVAGTDYTVKVTYDENGEAVEIENPVITPSWLDADGNDMDETPVNAGSYQVLLTYTDTTGRYAECSSTIPVKIHPVSAYIQHTLSKTEYADRTKEADVLKTVEYEVYKQADNTKLTIDKGTFWGVSYNDDMKTQFYEPVFKLQVAERGIDKDGNPIYGSWKDNNGKDLDGSKIDGQNKYKYRVVFSGKKVVRWADGTPSQAVDINDRGTNSAEINYNVDVTEKVIEDHAKEISVSEAPTITIDISAYDKTEKIYDGKPFEGYETRSGYKKAKVTSGELSYEWYESIDTETTVDSDGQEHTEYIWSDTPIYEWNITYPDGTTDTSFSPVDAGVYKLLISYNDPTGANTAKDEEIIHIIHRQKVMAEIGTGTEAKELTTYSGVKIADFIADVGETLAKSVKPAKKNNLADLGDDLGWEYDEDYDFKWFIQRKDNLTGEWTDVYESSGKVSENEFYEGDEYQLSVGVRIMPDTKRPYKFYDNNYQSYNKTKDGVEYYSSNTIPVKVVNMGTTPISIVVDSTKITQTTRPYNEEAFAVPADAVSAFDNNTGNSVADIELKYTWYDNTAREYVAEAVNGGTYDLYVSFDGNETYAPSDDRTKVGTFEITKLEVGFMPVLYDTIWAGNSAAYGNVADPETVRVFQIDQIPASETYDFMYSQWTDEDGALQEGYKAFNGFSGSVKRADGSSVPNGVLKSNVAYYAQIDKVYFNSPYERNYTAVYRNADFEAERDAAFVQKTDYDNVPATSLKDTIDGFSHTIMPREGIAYTSKAITVDGKTLSGNFFVFEIQAPLEFYRNGSRYNNYIGDAPVVENSLNEAKGYLLGSSNGTITVAFLATEDNKTKQTPFTVRWEDGYAEEFTVDFTNAVLEADLRKAVAPKSLAFNNLAKKMVIGEKQQLDVKVTKKQLDDIICLRYETDNLDVLSVSDTGAVVAIKAGTANVKVIPCYLDDDGHKIDITGAKAATAKITVTDVTAPKIKGVTSRDTWAAVTYPALADGYRREIYVVEGTAKVTADQVENKIANIVNGDWRSAGFATKPIYTASEDTDSKNIARVKICGLKANTAYTVYVRNVSGVRTLAGGKTVALSCKGAVKNFKTTLSEVKGLDIIFDEKYEDEYEDNAWRAALSEKKVPSITNGRFVESAINAAANAEDEIRYALPFAKGSEQSKYYAQPKLSYYVTESVDSKDVPLGLHTLKIGERYYRPTTLASVDKKGAVTLKGVGTVYVWVYEAVTGIYDYTKLYITAEPAKFTLAKSAKVKVGASICLGDYATYFDRSNKKVPGDVNASLVIKDVSGDKDSFIISTDGLYYDPVLKTYYYDTYVTAKEANKKITLTVSAELLGTRETSTETEATITITSSAIDSVKNLKVSDIVDRYATYSFTYPASALRLWDGAYLDEDNVLWTIDTPDTTSAAQLYFRVQVLDAAKKIVSDEYINPYRVAKAYNAKTKTYTFEGQLNKLNRKSSYTVSVTAVYLGQTQDQVSKAVNKGFKTTDIPAAYQEEYGGSFYAITDKNYKTADGGIGIRIGDTYLREYPALTSNNTYTLIAVPDNVEAKNRLTDTLTWKSTNTKAATVKANAGSYTATLKALNKGTTQIELTSKVTKRIIARWTVHVNATGEATYYYGDWEPDEDLGFVNGIEFGDVELLTVDNKVKATLASGEGKIAKFVAPAAGTYRFTSSGLNMVVYTYDEETGDWTSSYLNSDYGREFGQDEVSYIVVWNQGSKKAVAVTISAAGTIYGTLTMDGFKKTDSAAKTMVFTAPEDNVYTFMRDNSKSPIRTVSLKANETAKITLPYGTYEVSVSKRVPDSIDLTGKTKETIGAGTTKWYVFEAPSAMDYTFAATSGTIKVYNAITETDAEDSTTISLAKGKKAYISVENSDITDITADITVKTAAQVGTAIDTSKTTTTRVDVKEADKAYYVQLTIPEDGYYRIKTTGNAADEAAKAVPGLTVRLAESTTDGGRSISTNYEGEFKKNQILYVVIESDTAATTAELAVTKIDAAEIPDEKVTIGSDYSYFKYTAKTEGSYIVKTDSADVIMEMSDVMPSQSWNEIPELISMKAGEVKYFRVRTSNTEAVETKITAVKAEAEEFTGKKEVKLAKDETKWLHFTASEDTLYSFTAAVAQAVEGTGSVNVYQGGSLNTDNHIGTNAAPGTGYYREGRGFYLKLTADAEVTYTIEARPVQPENITGKEFTIARNSEKWFQFTAPVTAKYSVKLTGDKTNVSIAQYSLTNGTNLGYTEEIMLDAGRTVYYKVVNGNADDKKVTLTIGQLTFTALDVSEGGKNSDTATLAAGDSVWYSFTAPKGGRYSFNVTTADTASASFAYFTEKYENKTGVDSPENAVLLKAKETIYVKTTLSYAASETAAVTTAVKAIEPENITANTSAQPVEKEVKGAVRDSYNWYFIEGEGTYTVTISEVTEGGSCEARYVKNDETYFGSMGSSSVFTLGKDDVYTIAIKALYAEQLGYKVKVEKRDVNELSIGEAGAISASLKNTETLYARFKVPEDGRYAVRLEGLTGDVTSAISETSGSMINTINNGSYYTFYGRKGNTATMAITVDSTESVSIKAVAEAVTTTDISATGSAAIDITKTPAGYMSWYAYTANENGKHTAKVSDPSATVYWYGADDTLYSGSSSNDGEAYLNKDRTYYYAVYYSGKPSANVEFSIAKVKANELVIKDGETSASLPVEVSKVAPGVKYYVSFTAPEDGRYSFSFETEGSYSFTSYDYGNHIDNSGVYNHYYGNFEIPVSKAQTVIFATSYSGTPDKDYSIKVEKVVPEIVDKADEVKEITIAPNSARYVAVTADKTCDITVTIAPVEAEDGSSTSVYYEIYNNMADRWYINSDNAYSYEARTYKYTLPEGAAKYFKLRNDSSAEIKVNMKYTDGEEFTAISTGTNPVSVDADSSKVVYFTSAEDAVYRFSHSGRASSVSIKVGNDVVDFDTNGSYSEVCLNKGDTAFVTLSASYYDVSDTITVTRTNDIKVTELDKETSLAVNDSNYAYMKISAEKAGNYMLSLGSSSTLYRMYGNGLYWEDWESIAGGTSKILLNLTAGETAVYRIYNSNSRIIAAALFYMGEDVVITDFYDECSFTINKGEEKYVDLSGVTEDNGYNNLFNLRISANNSVSVQYLHTLSSEPENMGVGKSKSFTKRLGSKSYIKITGTADKTTVDVSASGVEGQIDMYERGVNVSLRSNVSFRDYILCGVSAYYYFTFAYASRIDILNDAGVVIKSIPKDEQGESSAYWLNSTSYYTIRVYNESQVNEEDWIGVHTYNQDTVSNVPFSRWVSGSYEQYYFDFTAPGDGTYLFSAISEESSVYSSLYDNQGNLLASADNRTIQRKLREGEQVQLRTSPEDMVSYQVSIQALIITDVTELPYEEFVSAYAGSTRWYNFTAPHDGTYVFYSTYDSNDETDTCASLYDSQGNEITYDDDSGEGLNFRIIKVLQAGECVLLETRLLDSYESGSYCVHIEEQATAEE